MKKFFLTVMVIGSILPMSKAQCPPGASAFESIYPLCPAGCGVLLKDWPEGVIVNVFGGTPTTLITSGIIPGTYGGSTPGDAFVCVPCNIALTFASSVPGATSGCVINTGGIIPVKLYNFSAASATTNSCSLKWSTAYESGNVHFIIQRSNDGLNFTDICTITGSGSSSMTREYTYSDIAAGQGNVYYRIKMIEVTQKVSFSEISLVKNQSNFEVSLYPNPVKNTFKVTLPSQYLPAFVSVYDVHGKMVYSQTTMQATLLINNAIAPGVYAVKVIANNKISVTQKFIKQ